MVQPIPLRPETGFEVFLSEVTRPFGALVAVDPDLVVYVENAGEFTIPKDAVKAIHDEKVILDSTRLDQAFRDAIARAHTAEDRY